MAIFFQHSINDSTKLGIWKIEETESFFLEKVPLKRQVTHPYKRLQHLAGRLLLPELFDDFPLKEIIIADTRKPFLEDDIYHFSISHCGNFAAAIASRKQRVGVDIEFVSPRLKGIARKFLTPGESSYLEQWKDLSTLHLQMITLIWSAKEAMFKWYGAGNVDFREHMVLDGVIEVGSGEWITMPFRFKKEGNVELKIMAKTFDGMVLAYVAT
ncbi:MAG: 4'-phosphopantetheinyl transferase superfamily protein [Chitinophagaceae bacterium]|nr:MAG: 4'-phosphopantetheinyl transferase superfamily protein [Chitinophagaceae bacterium]